jgi:organic radical activating enzyme
MLHVYFISQVPNSNSSSTHYLVKPGVFHGDPGGYGWGVGVVSNDGIEHYLFSQICSSGNDELIKKFKKRYPWAKDMDPDDVDHQSAFSSSPPLRRDGSPYEEFKFSLMDTILASDAEILISNDNGGERPEDDQNHKLHDLFNMLQEVNSRYTIYENTANTVVVSNGFRKYIIKFTDDATVLPYLCDIKITDYCERGCSWCYQNSSKSGKHASLESIQRFIEKYPHVVEVALGGGEATLHPQFDKIVNMLNGSGIAVNLTTRNIKWFNRPTTRSLNSIAISVDSVSQLGDGLKQATYASEMCSTGRVQPGAAVHLIAWPKTIIELADTNLNELMAKYGRPNVLHVVLLDPKATNNESVDRYNRELNEVGQDAVTEAMQRIVHGGKHWRIAVDTPLVKRYKDVLEFNRVYMREEDGELSFYYDAVEDKVYKSSYEKDADYRVQER